MNIFNNIFPQNELAELINQAGYEFMAGNFKAALERFREAEDFAHKSKLWDKYGDLILGNIGATLTQLGETEEAISVLEHFRYIPDDQITTDYSVRALGNLGVAYSNQSRTLDARELYDRCLSLSQKYNWQEDMAKQYNNLGTLFHEEGHLEFALRNYFHALEIIRQINDKRTESECLGNIGHAYQELNLLDDAQNIVYKRLTLRRK